MSIHEQYSPFPQTIGEAIKDVGLRTAMFIGGAGLMTETKPENPPAVNITIGLAAIALAIGSVFKPLIVGAYHDIKVMREQKKEEIIFSHQNTGGGGI